MARQTGIVKLKGTIGDISFYKSIDGHMAREKGGVDANRIKNDPAFVRTRENGAEFGRAGKGSKLLRQTFRLLLQNTKDRRVVSRLTTEMLKVIQSDTVNERGQRTAVAGMTELLQGFDFNSQAPLTGTLYAPYTATIDRATGDLTVSVPSFTPSNDIVAPAGTTHFKVVSGGGEIDFDNEVSIVDIKESAILPWSSNATAALNLANSVTANSTHPLFLLLGIQFYQEVNGNYYPLKNGAYNTLAVVKVNAA
jgi:hypothetical protein